MNITFSNLIGYTLFASMVLLGFLKKDSDRVTRIMGLYMWFIIAFNTSSADYLAYKEMYYCAFEPRYSDHEIGYMALSKICLRLGLSYLLFRCIIAFIIVYVTIISVEKFAIRKNCVLSLYLLFPFLSCASGLRQSCANAIVLYAMNYLLKGGRNSNLKFLICLCFAALFHYSSLFFILMLFAKYSKTNVLSMLIRVFVAGVGFIAIAKTNIIYRIVSRYTSREKTLRWLKLQVNYSGLYIVAIVLFIIFLLCVYQSIIVLKKNSDEGSNNDTENGEEYLFMLSKIDSEQAWIIIRCIIMSMLAFVGAMLNSVVHLRLVLTLLPVGYALCTDAYASSEIQNGVVELRSFFYISGLVLLCLFCTWFVFGFWIGGDTLTVPIGNPIFGG